MTPAEIGEYRLITQQLIKSKHKNAIEMITWFGAVQAQEYAQTKWSLGLRLPHLKEIDIEKDFNEGKILRTHLLRPTWHFVTAQDIRWLLILTSSRVNAANAYMYRKLELEGNLFNRCNDILERALQGGKQLTREALNLEFDKDKIKAAGLRLGYIMMRAELDGIICSGAKQGNQFTYALLNERVPPVKAKTHEEALAELTKRYFTSRGPATVRDFSTWSGLTLIDCKKGIEMTKPDFITEIVNNDTYYFPSGISLDEKRFHQIHLLPIYDEFIMGYKNRDAILQFRNTIKPKPTFNFDCTIVYEGQIIGTWKRTIKAKTINIEFDFFKPLTKIQKVGFENALLHLKKFTGLEINFKSTDEES